MDQAYRSTTAKDMNPRILGSRRTAAFRGNDGEDASSAAVAGVSTPQRCAAACMAEVWSKTQELGQAQMDSGIAPDAMLVACLERLVWQTARLIDNIRSSCS